MRIGTKIAALGAGCSVAATVATIIISLWQLSLLARQSHELVHSLIEADSSHILSGAVSEIAAVDKLLAERLHRNIGFLMEALRREGGFSLSNVPGADLTVTDPLSKASKRYTLPRLELGGAPFDPQTDPAVPVRVLDDVAAALGGFVAIAVRLPKTNDFVVIGTNAIAQGRRAIGGVIGANETSTSALAGAIASGTVFAGLSEIDGRLALVESVPLRSPDTGREGIAEAASGNEVIGMAVVGFDFLEATRELRSSLQKITVGRDGYIYAFPGTGPKKGFYAVSKDGAQDGQNKWDTVDASGEYPIRKIIEKGLLIQSGGTATHRYLWKNPGESEPRAKIAQIAYYKPWDWVIGAGRYEEEYRQGAALIERAKNKFLVSLVIAAAICALLLGFLSWRVALGVSRRLRSLTGVTEALAAGDVHRAEELLRGGGR